MVYMFIIYLRRFASWSMIIVSQKFIKSIMKWSYFRTSVFTMMNNRIVQPILNKGRVRENKPKSVSICC